MKTAIFTGPMIKLLTIVGVILAFGLVVYWKAGVPAPREQDRISTVNGSLSIIKRRDWESRIVYAPTTDMYVSSIQSYPADAIGLGEKLFVGQLRAGLEVEKLKARGFKPIQFQGREAYASAAIELRQYVWRMYFDRDGEWYEISLHLYRPDDVPISRWWKYLESFRSKRIAVGSTTGNG